MTKLYLKLKASRFSAGKTGVLLISIVATLWFLIRVIPKPIRATYPCMKTAAPFMSGLVIYLLSFYGGGVAYFRFKRNWLHSNYRSALGFMVLSLAAVLLFIGNNSTDSLSVNKSSKLLSVAANSPVGNAIGYYPGRVVWAYNPDATNENCKNIKDDFWFQNTDVEVVQKMMDDAILSLTSSNSIAEGWDKLFRNFNVRHGKGKTGYQSGEKIVIKINTTNTSATQYEYGARMDATPEVLYALLKHLINDVGVKQEDIYAGDPFRVFADPLWNLCKPAFPNVHYIDCFGKNGREQTKITTSEVLVFSDKKYKSRLPASYMDAAYMINLPCMKSHGSAGISIAAKNHQGSILAADQSANSQSASHLHYDFPDSDRNALRKYRHLVDYMGHEKLGGNTVLYIVDAIWSGTDWNGAVEKWGMKPFNNDYTSSLFLSQDAVAIESVCYDFLFAEYSSFSHYNAFKAKGEYPLWPATRDYILQAASPDNWPANIQYDPEGDGRPIGSLGVYEKWNNATDKQYSNNLTGIVGGIELVSVPANLVAGKKVEFDPLPIHFGTSAAQKLKNQDIKIYPNPFIDCLSIDLPDSGKSPVTVELFDTASKLVFSQKYTSGRTIRIDELSSLKRGIYTVRISSGNKMYSTSICK